MSIFHIEIQVTRIVDLIGMASNERTRRVYVNRLVAMMDKRKALTAATVSAR